MARGDFYSYEHVDIFEAMTDAGNGTAPSGGGGMQTALASLDPQLAVVLGQILSNTQATDTRIEQVEKSQKDMEQNLQKQIDTLANAIADTSRPGDAQGTVTASGGIEHMFMQGDNIDASIKRHVDAALAGINMPTMDDPFAPIQTPDGEYMSHRA